MQLSSTLDETVTRRKLEPYALATGEAAVRRLMLLHELYAPGTWRVLHDAGIRSGIRVADFGCGIGTVTQMLGGIVAPGGHAVGFDVSAGQITEARERAKENCDNVTFVQASAIGTGWPAESFDLVYCRLLLIHLQRPEAALAEMARLLKPGGILVCEEGDLTSAGSVPESVLDAFAKLFGRLGPQLDVDYTLGQRLYQMVSAAGFTAPQIAFNQPVVARGATKRLLEMSVAEAGPVLVEAGLITDDDLASTIAEMRFLADDDDVLAVMPRMTQVWARKG